MTTRVDSEFTTGVIKTSEKSSKVAVNASAGDEGKIVQLNASGKIPSAFISSSSGLEISERSTDPANPAEGSAVIWMSNGSGSGDDGDILIKITAGGATKTATLVDFSGV